MEIKFNTPSWVDMIYDTAKYAKSSIKWIVSPPRCACCGKRLHHTSTDIEVTTPTRMKISNGKALWCQECIAKEVDTVESRGLFNLSQDPEVSDKCDSCGEKTRSYRFYSTENIDLRFCLQWWNGFHICKPCITNCLRNGNQTSSYFIASGTSLNKVGAYGLFLDENGKVILFKVIRKWNSKNLKA